MSVVNLLLARISTFAPGYKTKAAGLATALLSLANFAGLLPLAYAIPLAGVSLGLAHIFQRMATAENAFSTDSLKADIADIKQIVNAIKGTPTPPAAPSAAVADESPATIPFKPDGLAALLLLLAISGSCYAQERPPITTSMQLAPETRNLFRNPDGSCVQCSIGMAGVHCNDINAATLLWDTAYGPAVRGGSWPSRVEQYCDQRGIKAWSVTGETVEETMPWIVWAAKTGRFAAIGAGSSHFQTLYGYEPNTDKPWMVCNNNSPTKIDRYSDREFRQLHAACGPWVVILEKPSSEPPALVKWWK